MPPEAHANGAGDLCYQTPAECYAGPNACNPSLPCTQDPTSCATGSAAGTGAQFVCLADRPPNVVPNGAGMLCYQSELTCNTHSNGCAANSSLACLSSPGLCSTGQAAGSGYSFVCPTDAPPGSLPNGAGNWCYNTQFFCEHGLNGCNSATGRNCTYDVATCSTGMAANQGHSWFCELDAPANSVPNAAGELCYSTSVNCLTSPNNCGVATPCVNDPAACSTGQAEWSPNSWFCHASLPPGSAPNGAGCVLNLNLLF